MTVEKRIAMAALATYGAAKTFPQAAPSPSRDQSRMHF